jgi:hypothetical protein
MQAKLAWYIIQLQFLRSTIENKLTWQSGLEANIEEGAPQHIHEACIVCHHFVPDYISDVLASSLKAESSFFSEHRIHFSTIK